MCANTCWIWILLYEHLEGQLVHEERIQSTATDKISTVTFQNLTFHSKCNSIVAFTTNWKF